jgi:hypothetical protein
MDEEGRIFGKLVEPVTLHIETVDIGNDKTDDLGWQCIGIAAICYDEGEHQGFHYVLPANGGPADYEAAKQQLLDMIEGSGFPYKVIEYSETARGEK